jgi:nucleoside-diphosphate-sugar epimerase
VSVSPRRAGSRILVTGGAGYVGSALVPHLLSLGYEVTVYDLFLYGSDVFEAEQANPGLRQVKADLRDVAALRLALQGCDSVIHLACISNDPSFDLAPELGRSINYDAFRPLVRAAKESGVTRFINASSSSVYGVKAERDVTEELALEPLTDYSRFKALCEDVLQEESVAGFTTVSVRPATVCGYARRLRLDLVVNLLTNHAVNAGAITVFGGGQLRPSIHIADMVEAYVRLLEAPASKVDGQRFNAGHANCSLLELAGRVRAIVGEHIPVRIEPTADPRSYHVSSDKIRRELGFEARRPVDDAIHELTRAFRSGQVPRPLDDDRYFNVARMKALRLQ